MRGEIRPISMTAAPAQGRTRAETRKPGSRIRRLSMLRFLADSAQDLNSSLALQDVFRKIAERVRSVIDYHLFCVMLWNERSQLLEHSFTLCLGEPGYPPGKGFPLGHGLSGAAAALRQSIRVDDVRKDARYVRFRHPEVDIRSELVVPILYQGRLIGVLDLESMEEGTFTEEHEEMLSALASQMATALQNARLYETVLAKERRHEEELATAGEIQKGLLPGRTPRIPGLEIGMGYAPAAELGGDFYDLVASGDGRLGVVVGDVAGKSTPAALYGSLAIGILRGHFLQSFPEPTDLLDRMNEQLRLPRVRNRFLAMIYAVYDARDRALILSNAGFPWPYLVREGRVSRIAVGGVPLGLFSGYAYDQEEIALRSGDVLAFCSDGVTDSENPAGEPFGDEGLEALLARSNSGSAHEIANEVLRVSARHAGGTGGLRDDRTVVVLKVNGGPGAGSKGRSLAYF